MRFPWRGGGGFSTPLKTVPLRQAAHNARGPVAIPFAVRKNVITVLAKRDCRKNSAGAWISGVGSAAIITARVVKRCLRGRSWKFILRSLVIFTSIEEEVAKEHLSALVLSSSWCDKYMTGLSLLYCLASYVVSKLEMSGFTRKLPRRSAADCLIIGEEKNGRQSS